VRICSGAGCLRAVPDDVRLCDECKPKPVESDGIRSNERAGVYNEELDKLRKGTRWQKVRLVVIKRDPFCKRCDQAVSEIVDHIVPADIAIRQARESRRWPLDKYAGYYLTANLQGLCRSCHGIKTVEDKAHQGEWLSVTAMVDAQPKKHWIFH
jgi:5-methylcytosine-specific restriction endonuclease McrA